MFQRSFIHSFMVDLVWKPSQSPMVNNLEISSGTFQTEVSAATYESYTRKISLLFIVMWYRPLELVNLYHGLINIYFGQIPTDFDLFPSSEWAALNRES